MKEVFAPHLNRTVKLGRKRPVSVGPRMKLGNYLRLSLPTPPANADYSAAAKIPLANIYDNDTLGCCVIAGGYHIAGVETGNATGKAFEATSAQIIADYSAIGGYVPGDPSTDQGCDEATALDYWQNHGYADGTKIMGSLTVDASSYEEVMAALYLFENLVICMELPDAYVNPFPSNGGIWDVAGPPVPENGHSIAGVAYDPNGVTVSTWGILVHLTKAALAKYAVTSAGGSLNVILTPDQIAKGAAKAPNGVAWADLIADFNALGGHVPLPAPAPAPPPLPPATGGVSLAQAEAAVKTALTGQPWLISSTQATAAATKALAALKGWPT
jgi:hypothetical protein